MRQGNYSIHALEYITDKKYEILAEHLLSMVHDEKSKKRMKRNII